MSENLSILLVEDDPDHALLAMRAFAASVPGALVRVCPTAEAAWATLSDPNRPLPRAVFADVHLSGESGIDFVARIKSHPRLARLPAIIITADCDDASRTRALACRADAYFTKPLSGARLTQMFQAGNFVWDIGDLPVSLDEFRRKRRDGGLTR